MNTRRTTRRFVAAFAAAFATIGVGVAQAEFTWLPQVPNPGGTVNFTADAADCGVLSLNTCTWTFGDGGAGGTGPAPSHQYTTTPGTYPAILTVTPPMGVATVYSHNVTVNAPPTVGAISGSSLVQLNGALQFSASSNEQTTFTWTDNGTTFATTGLSTLSSVSRSFSVAGNRTITVQATDPGGLSDTSTLVVFVNRPPVAGFTYSPTNPVVGDTVTFTSVSTDPDAGDPLTASWDLDGNGVFGDATGATASTTYAASGSRTVRLTVADSHGGSNTAFNSVDIAPKQTTSGPKLLSPFPRIHYAGRLTKRGVKITLFTVSAPKGATVKATCKKHCPAKSFKRTARRTGSMSLKKMKGTYKPGAVLRLSITQKDLIGKYTLISVPKGAAPKRTDKCLYPSSKKPAKCPS